MTIRHMPVAALTAAALSLIVINSPAFAQGASQTQATQPIQGTAPAVISDKKIEAFAVAYLQVDKVRQDYAAKIGAEKDATAKQKLQNEANKQMINAVEKSPGMSRPKIMLLLHTYVGDGQADIDQAARELSVYYNYFFAWFRNQRPISQGLIQRLSQEELAENPNLAPEMMKTNMPVGTADEVIRRLKVYEDLGYDEYSLWIDSGMSFARKKASLERFIGQVMPAFG